MAKLNELLAKLMKNKIHRELFLALCAVFVAVAFTVSAAAPVVTFVDPTPANNAAISGNSVTIKATTTGDTVALDWNKSLVGWWRFNGEAGESSTLLKDWSSYGNNAVCSGSSCPTVVAGKFGKALQFDGKDDYLNCGSAASLNIDGYVTVSLWAKFNDKTDDIILSKGIYPNYNYKIETSKGSIGFVLGINGDQRMARKSGYETNKWYHLAGTYDGKTIKFYIDGQLAASTVYSGKPAQNENPVIIGKYLGGSGTEFNGLLDDVSIYNRALSEMEIKSIYDAQAYPLQANFPELTNGIYLMHIVKMMMVMFLRLVPGQ